jgi:hypothetical protein
MPKRKQNTSNIVLYSAIGIASGFTINELQRFFLYWYYRKQSFNLYKQGVEKYGNAFILWWLVQKVWIDYQLNQLTEAEKDAEVQSILTDPKFAGVKEKEVLDAESWYKSACKWLGKPGYFKQAYSISNYALVVVGVLPLITQIKNQTLQYIMYGAGVVGLFNAIKYNATKDIYKKLQPKSTKLYWQLIKAIDQELYNASFSNDRYGYAGYIVYDIFDLSEQNPEDKPTTEETNQ